VFLVLFLAHLVVMFVLCGVYAPKMLNDKQDYEDPNGAHIDTEAIAVFVTAAAVGCVFSAIWLEIMKKFAGTLIKTCLIITNVFLGITVLICFIYNQIELAVCYVIFMLFSLLYFYLVRRRIPFAQEILSASCSAITEYTGPIWVTYIVAFFQIGWFAFWAFTFVSVLYAGNRIDPKTGESSGVNNGVVFFLLVSLYWTGQVLMNIGHVTTAGVVGAWWFQPGTPSPTKGAFKRACTTSLGSICFGSLIVAVLQATRAMIRSGRNRGGGLLICCLGCIERLIRYFNLYAYTQVAIYGKDFRQAASDTWDLFVAQGFTMIINDDLTGMVLQLGMFLGGAAAAVVSALWGMASYDDIWWVFAVMGFLIGYIMSALFMTVISSAVATTLVCWAEDPNAVAANRPEFFQRIRAAAMLLYPTFGSGNYSAAV
jgi:hypothetical protein